jgi:integration host factor subunit beta
MFAAHACDPCCLEGLHAQIWLTRRLSEQNPHLYAKDLEKVVDAIFDQIGRALARGDRVEFRGFGTFAVKTWGARPGRNPNSGAIVDIPEKRYPSFRTRRPSD